MTDEAEDSGCTSQDPDDVVSTGGGGNNNNNNNGSALLTAAVHSTSKKSKPSSVESAEVPGKSLKTCLTKPFEHRQNIGQQVKNA